MNRLSRVALWLAILSPSLVVGQESEKERQASATQAGGQPPVSAPATPNPPTANASETATGPSGASDAGAGDLASRQGQLAEKYRQLEERLFKMADFEADTNPRRAALLKQAYKLSKERMTSTQMAKVADLIAKSSLKNAVDGQEATRADLKALLELLLSENREDRLKSEQERIKEMIKELTRLERMQRANRGRTESGSDMKELAEDQGKIADRTGDVAKTADELDGKSGQGKPDEGKPDEGKPGDGKPGEAKPDEGKSDGEADPESETPPEPADGADMKDGDAASEGRDSEKKNDPDKKNGADKKNAQRNDADQKNDRSGENKDQDAGKSAKSDSQSPPSDQESKNQQNQRGKPKKGSPKSGSPKDGGDPPPPEDPSSSPPDQQQEQETPSARKRIHAAEERMREAKKQLEQARREQSVEAQKQAEEELKKAISELEAILRQLREEELERVLAMLEGRFRKMLAMQQDVYEGTLKLLRVPEESRDEEIAIRANQWSVSQRKIVLEAERALTLLHEEGSSIAFPETVEQMRDDMQQVADRLAATRVDRITQGVEEEIIQTLEELIAALQQAQKDLEEQKQRQQQPPPPGDEQEEPLVDAIAELKMIRSLQMRINARTKRYSQLLDDEDDLVGQAAETELQEAISRLGEREAKVHQITRGLVLGKNK